MFFYFILEIARLTRVSALEKSPEEPRCDARDGGQDAPQGEREGRTADGRHSARTEQRDVLAASGNDRDDPARPAPLVHSFVRLSQVRAQRDVCDQLEQSLAINLGRRYLGGRGADVLEERPARDVVHGSYDAVTRMLNLYKSSVE
jgi:hypothetical protein